MRYAAAVLTLASVATTATADTLEVALKAKTAKDFARYVSRYRAPAACPARPDACRAAEGRDRGHSYWRYKQVDGGVLVEIESLTLSRSLPPIVGSLIRPVITSTARESMTRTLASVRARFMS